MSNFQSNGTFSYTPTTGYRGFDSFTYRVSDGTANSNTVEALIAVGGYLGPRTNQDGSPQDLSLLHGSLERVEQLTPGVTLTYQSDTQANAIVVVDTSLLGSSVPSAISAQLTFNGTAGTSYGYNTYGLSPGRSLRFALQANTSALSTGRYNWQMDVTTTTYGMPTVHSFTGSTNVVNRNSSSAPYRPRLAAHGPGSAVCPDGRRAVGAERRHEFVVRRQRLGRLSACGRGQHLLDAGEEREPDLHALRYARQPDEFLLRRPLDLARGCQQQHDQLLVHERTC